MRNSFVWTVIHIISYNHNVLTELYSKTFCFKYQQELKADLSNLWSYCAARMMWVTNTSAWGYSSWKPRNKVFSPPSCHSGRNCPPPRRLTVSPSVRKREWYHTVGAITHRKNKTYSDTLSLPVLPVPTQPLTNIPNDVFSLYMYILCVCSCACVPICSIVFLVEIKIQLNISIPIFRQCLVFTPLDLLYGVQINVTPEKFS